MIAVARVYPVSRLTRFAAEKPARREEPRVKDRARIRSSRPTNAMSTASRRGQAAEDERVGPAPYPRERHGAHSRDERDREQDRATQVEAGRERAASRSLPPRCNEHHGDDRDGHVEEEDPLPGARSRPGIGRVEVEEHPGDIDGADRHPDEDGGPLDAERDGAGAPRKEVAGQRHRERNQRAAPKALDHPRGDQPVEPRSGPANRASPAPRLPGAKSSRATTYSRRAPHRSAALPASGIATR